MNIVIAFAVPSEYSAWRRSSESLAGVRVVFTGIGFRHSQDQLRELLAVPADLCIASGLAGSLNNRYAVGSIVVARGVKTETKNTTLVSDEPLVDAAVSCGAEPVDFFYTSQTIVNSASERSKLREHADVVDMESFHILAEAQHAGVPAVAIRAISDCPGRSLPVDFNRVINDRGEIAWLPMFAELAKHPGRIGELVRFGVESSNATRNLAAFLGGYLRFLLMKEQVSA